MSTTDVSQLAQESLADEQFPAALQSDFRVFFADDVHTAIARHASEDTSIEICGVLVGEWKKDANGPFARISDFIRCDDAASKNTEVTFTHESWAQINNEMDSRYSDKRIIGWYHSHPDFGIFLSDRDMFIQEHFFNGPGQIAYVVDPVRKLEGVFEWRHGKADLMSHYWAGNTVIPVHAARNESRADQPRTLSGGQPAASRSMADHPRAVSAQLAVSSPMQDSLPLTTLALSALALFLLGLLLGQWRSSIQERYLAEGAVAHYGLWNVLQIGRSEQINAVQLEVSQSFDSLTDLSRQHTASIEDADVRKKVTDDFQKIRKQLANARDALKSIEAKYSVTPEQQAVLSQVVATHISALNGVDTRRQLPIPIPITTDMLQQQLSLGQEKATTSDDKAADKDPSKPADKQPLQKASPKKPAGKAPAAGPPPPPSGQ